MQSILKSTLIALLLVTSAAAAADGNAPYDEKANAKAQIRTTLAEAKRARVPVLVVFGANWCGDCKILDMAFKSGTSAPLIAKNFRVVKVDVGRFDRNVDIATAYGVPLKSGIPAVAILSQTGEVVYATREGELADARKMGDSGIYDFFSKVSAMATAR
jgi:thioredoxin 1